jgi:hypothetical protein
MITASQSGHTLQILSIASAVLAASSILVAVITIFLRSFIKSGAEQSLTEMLRLIAHRAAGHATAHAPGGTRHRGANDD